MPAELSKRGCVVPRPVRRHRLPERGIAAEQIDVLVGRRLVGNLVGADAGGHDVSPELLPVRLYHGRLWTAPPRALCALARAPRRAYRFRFNEHRPQVLVRSQQPPFAGDRRAFVRRHRRSARSGRGIRRAQPPDREENRVAARPHPHQHVLRGLDPDAGVVRARRQAARRRRDEHVGVVARRSARAKP